MDIKPLTQSRISSYVSWVGARTQSTLKKSPSNVKTFWLDSQRQARSDFRARSGRGCLWVLAFLWFLGLTAGFALLCVFSSLTFSGSSRNSNYLSACLPDDSFNLRPDTYRYWSKSGFFQITLGSGNLTFTQAKAIDVIWDIVIGRGGQGLLAYLSWQTFIRYVSTSMEVQPVTFNTYRTVFLQNGSLILGIPRIIRDFCRRRGLHSRFAMVFIVLTMIFILIFPTLGSAMTGYSGNVKPYVPDLDGNFIPFNNFSIVLYTIHDGKRIGQTDDFHATIFKEANSNDPVLSDISYWNPMIGYTLNCASFRYDYERSRCASDVILWNISAYIGQYGTDPTLNLSSTFGDISLEPPTLKITAYDLPSGLNRTTYDPRYSSGSSGSSPAMFLASDQLYTQEKIEIDGQCQAQKTYQWGFSFVQLNIMIILLWVWTLGIIVMYTSSKFTMKQRGREDVAGEYKAVFELSGAMHLQLAQIENEEAKDVQQITESNLRQRITKDLRGGTIAYDTALLPERNSGAEGIYWTLKAWTRREMWWLIATAVSIIVDGFVVKSFIKDKPRNDLLFFLALPLALGFAMYVGSTHKSRVMVLFWAVLVVCVLPAIVLGIVVQMFM
ncbi:hypothetical protein BU25DRAFT_219774 [Macroventuria anomochaeta]|uniref:Uncharacterized protein n=1 Tax=Macroventuria anomochaeta TaxID=301207 RepID=A0ACB6RLZ9_9PLEO|nr:uncharacterized protein BU25DRAFT_219774 [Macroventuria anomochaeta]KAF2621982.1 hypothetical protein BU25DRAFT_219774 [Macroventuria anomochaeta]